MRISNLIIIILCLFIFWIYSCDKSPIEPKSGELVIEDFSVSINVLKDKSSNAYVTYLLKCQLQNQSGSITRIDIAVNDGGVSININPGSPSPKNTILESQHTYTIPVDLTGLDSAVVNFELEGIFHDENNIYNHFEWEYNRKLPIIRE